jgi:cytochrome c oxidase assembly protein subunit 15
MPVAGLVLLFVVVALLAGGWARQQWPLLGFVAALVLGQVVLGITTFRLGLSQPTVTISHQLLAALLVAVLAALAARSPDQSPAHSPVVVDGTTLETCHG